jgi:hypothetical protein
MQWGCISLLSAEATVRAFSCVEPEVVYLEHIADDDGRLRSCSPAWYVWADDVKLRKVVFNPWMCWSVERVVLALFDHVGCYIEGDLVVLIALFVKTLPLFLYVTYKRS